MSASGVPRLRISALQVRIGAREVLAIEHLTVAAGELTVIQGGAGSGKTTLAAGLCGSLLTGGMRISGDVQLDGQTLTGPPSRRMRSGLAAAVRDGERLSGCTVHEALQLADRTGERAEAALERLPQLATRAELSAALLSGGEQQLLQFAAAWCSGPRVLVLDAPTVGLAADAAQTVRALASEAAAEGAAVLWLDQDLRDAPGAAAYTLLGGRLTAELSGSRGAPSGPTAAPHPEPRSRPSG